MSLKHASSGSRLCHPCPFAVQKVTRSKTCLLGWNFFHNFQFICEWRSPVCFGSCLQKIRNCMPKYVTAAKAIKLNHRHWVANLENGNGWYRTFKSPPTRLIDHKDKGTAIFRDVSKCLAAYTALHLRILLKLIKVCCLKLISNICNWNQLVLVSCYVPNFLRSSLSCSLAKQRETVL
jgi:hypothetical protein